LPEKNTNLGRLIFKMRQTAFNSITKEAQNLEKSITRQAENEESMELKWREQWTALVERIKGAY
jgi:hypothetical protein